MSDMEDDIRAAMASLESDATEVVVAPEAIITEVDPANETPVELPDDGSEKPSDGRERGPDGKFIAKQPETVQDTPDQPSEAVADPAVKLAIRAPASWSPAAKATFDALPDEAKQAIAKREQEIDHGLRRKSEEVKRYEPLEQIIAPRRAVWAAQGMDEASAIKTLLAAQDLLERDPKQGLEFLARSYGVSIPSLSAQPQGQPQQAQPTPDSHPEIASLKQQLQSLQAQVQTAQSAPLLSQIEAFQNDPANLYFENVRDDMAVLLNNGKAVDLKEAYEMACWMRPDIRPLLQTPQAPAVAVQDRAAQARRAAVSVTGSPGQTAIRKSNGTIEDDIRAAFEEVSGNA
jgi:hypothetical protein